MTDIWIVLAEDRHADVDARPFSSEELAVAAARRQAELAAIHDDVDWDAGITPGMREDGWVLYLPYGSEGDCVRVVRRTLDAPEAA
jgi:non-canonical (house-cleaning) NTP pyrophosphatase